MKRQWFHNRAAFSINVSINNGKEIVFSCFDVVKIRYFFEMTMHFGQKMRFLG